MSFVHLHCHSHYSLLDGINSPTELVSAAVKAGQTAIAVTDHGSLAGHRELYRAAKAAGIKPIFGVEAYLSPTDRFDKRSVAKRGDGSSMYHHIILLAKNQKGVENINKMSEIAWTEGFHSKPRIDHDLLKEYREGVIVLTGCLSGIPASLIRRGMFNSALKWVLEMKKTFGEDLYIEVQAHNPGIVNNCLNYIALQAGVKTVATSDCHRADEKDKDLQDAFLIMSVHPSQDKTQDYSTTVGMDLLERMNALYPDRTMSFQDWNLFVQTRKQIESDFKTSFWNNPFDTTEEIAAKIGEYDYHEGLDLLPSEFEDPSGELEFKCLKAIREGNYGKKYYDRLDEELRVIKGKSFSPYFLIVEDIVTWARSQGILVGPGRGSAAGSLVCFLLGITTLDPIEDELLFFRFINEERNDYPDIDMDFQRSRRGEIKHYLEGKYGHVASIATYTYFRDKNTIKDAARVLGVPFNRVNKVLKSVSDDKGFDDYMTTTNKDVVQFRKAYPDVEKLGLRLRGKIRGMGMHAGGIVVSKNPISMYLPIETVKEPNGTERIPVVAADMKEVESVGLIKLDALGLNTLDVIADTMKWVGLSVDDMESIDRNDSEVLAQLNLANTVGVFQCDTNPYTRLLSDMQISSFEDLAVSNALIRPGAMNTVGADYLARAAGTSKITYVHPSIEEVLNKTYGTIIYQEQVMLTAVLLGGMSGSDADRLRKIIGKKGDATEFAQYKNKFMDGATEKISRVEASKLWSDFEAHAGYSFNRSHAFAYSKLSIWTLWLKLKFPEHYMAALLKNEDDKFKRTHYLIEVKKLDIPIYLPHVNDSGPSFEVIDGSKGTGIRFGLTNVKFISDKVFAKLVKFRPFEDLKDVKAKSKSKNSGLSSQAVSSLINTGATAPIGGPAVEETLLYDLLSMPTFNIPDMPDAPITNVDEFDEDRTTILVGMVQRIKRGKNGGGWSLIEVVDETGSVGFFDSYETDIVKNQFYYFLIDKKRLVISMTADELSDQAELPDSERNPLTRALLSDRMELFGDGSRYIIHKTVRQTRAGKSVADIFSLDMLGTLERMSVYSDDFSKIVPHVRVGFTYDFKLSETKRGDLLIKEYRCTSTNIKTEQ
jgi:DNA polymerase-3 subunit alpha